MKARGRRVSDSFPDPVELAMSKHERRAPRQSQLKLKVKEKIQLSKWREQACFWRQNSNYHRKSREQACFSMFSRWRQISNSNRMRNICRNGARSEADLAQCGALALPPPFFFCGCWCKFFFQRPLGLDTTSVKFQKKKSVEQPPASLSETNEFLEIVSRTTGEIMYLPWAGTPAAVLLQSSTCPSMPLVLPP